MPAWLTNRLGVVFALLVSLALVFALYLYSATYEQSIEMVYLEQAEATAPDPLLWRRVVERAYVTGGWDAVARALGGRRDEAGVIVLDNQHRLQASNLDVARALIEPAGETSYELRIVIGGSDAREQELVLSGVTPTELVDSAGATIGRLVVLPPRDTNTRARAFADSVTVLSLRSLAIIAAITGLFVLLITRLILRPVGRVREAAEALQRGELPAALAETSIGEVRELTRAFNAALDAVRRTERARKQIISDVSHELRTPITNLKGPLEAARDGLIPFDRALADGLLAETELLDRLVEDLYQLALHDTGQIRLATEPLALDEVFAELQVSLPALRKLDLRLHIDPGLLVCVDPDRWRQVVSNIVENTVRYGGADPMLEIRAQRTGDDIQIRFCDNGPGVSDRHRERLFERFYRVEDSRNRALGGAGLGLAIVKSLVEAHGGSIAASPNSGSGLCLRVTLPAYRQGERV